MPNPTIQVPPEKYCPATAIAPRMVQMIQSWRNVLRKGKFGRGGGAIRADRDVTLEEMNRVYARAPCVVRVPAVPVVEVAPESMATETL